MADLLAPFGALATVSPPPTFSLNQLAAASDIATGDGKPLRFVAPGGSTLTYPRAKAALNRKHYRTLSERRAAGETFRNSFQPLPLLGIPGVTPDSEDPAYYNDTRQFRPKRLQCEPEVRQAAAASQGVEESPGPKEQDAG